MKFNSVTIIRHSEANKTIKNIHGGKGTCLTYRGMNDSIQLSKELLEQKLINPDTIIYSSSRQQALQTASIVSSSIDIELSVEDKLINIDMGIFDGKTDEEARELNPKAMRRLELWREGKLPVNDIKIPESENLNDFLIRINLFLKQVENKTRNPIFFITRSTGIAVINLLQGYSSSNNKIYNRYRLDPGSITSMLFSASSFDRFSLENYTGYLEGEREFKDD